MTGYGRIRNARYTPTNTGPFAVFVLVALFILSGIVFMFVNATHVTTHPGCHVTDKDRTSDGNGGSNTRVYTNNCGNFTVKDSILSWTWHSSDTYGQIERGKTYDFKTRGYRIPFFSSFPNIVDSTEDPS